MGLRCGEIVVFVQVFGVCVDRLRNVPERGFPDGTAGIGPTVVALALAWGMGAVPEMWLVNLSEGAR